MEPITLDQATIQQLEMALKMRYAATPADCCGQAAAYTTSPQNAEIRPRSRRESNYARLQQTITQAKADGEKAIRVLSIVTDHPEFFDFLEASESGLIR
jgi:hypothetical protein